MKRYVLSFKLNGLKNHVNIHDRKALRRHLRKCVNANLLDVVTDELVEVLRSDGIDTRTVPDKDFYDLFTYYFMMEVMEMREYILEKFCIKDCPNDLYAIIYLLKANNLDFKIRLEWRLR